MNDAKSRVGCVLLFLLIGLLIGLTFFLMGGCNPDQLDMLVN